MFFIAHQYKDYEHDVGTIVGVSDTKEQASIFLINAYVSQFYDDIDSIIDASSIWNDDGNTYIIDYWQMNKVVPHTQVFYNINSAIRHFMVEKRASLKSMKKQIKYWMVEPMSLLEFMTKNGYVGDACDPPAFFDQNSPVYKQLVGNSAKFAWMSEDDSAKSDDEL